MWNIFSTFLFEQATLALLIKLYKTISNKYNLQQNIILLGSPAHGFSDILTAEILYHGITVNQEFLKIKSIYLHFGIEEF